MIDRLKDIKPADFVVIDIRNDSSEVLNVFKKTEELLERLKNNIKLLGYKKVELLNDINNNRKLRLEFDKLINDIQIDYKGMRMELARKSIRDNKTFELPLQGYREKLKEIGDELHLLLKDYDEKKKKQMVIEIRALTGNEVIVNDENEVVFDNIYVGNVNAKYALEKIREDHEDYKRIANSMQELYGLMNTFRELALEQDLVIDDIALHVGVANRDVGRGIVDLKDMREDSKKCRGCVFGICCCVFVLVGILVIIVIKVLDKK